MPTTEFEKRLTGAYSRPLWNAKKGRGSFLIFEVGEKVERNGVVQGEYSFWIYCCHWRLNNGDILAANSESPEKKIETAVSILAGHSLVSVRIEVSEAIWEFTDGIRLHTRPYSAHQDPPEDQWVVFFPDNHSVTFLSNGELLLESPDEPNWEPV